MKYEVAPVEFGKQLKGAIYVTYEALQQTFGTVPQKIKVTIEEVG